MGLVFFLLACLASLGCGQQPTWVGPHFYQPVIAPFTFDGKTFIVPAVPGNVLVCFVAFNKNTGISHALVNTVRVNPIQTRFLRPTVSTTTNTTVAFLFHVDALNPSIQFISGASAAGAVHCDQFSGVSGLEHFGSNQVSGTTFVTAGIESVCPTNVIAFGTFSSLPNVGSLTVAASSPTGTAGAMTKTSNAGAIPKQFGTTGFVTLSGTDPIPTGYTVGSTWSPPTAGLSMMLIGLSGCPTSASTTETCPVGSTCACRGSYCVIEGGPAPVATELTLSSFSNIGIISGGLSLDPTANVTANISSVYAGAMLTVLPLGSVNLDGQLTVIVAPAFVSPATGARSAQITQGSGGAFAAINYVSTDPCLTVTGTESFSTGLWVTVSATAVSSPACTPPPTCATMTPTCVHGVCSDVPSIGPTCSPCPSDGNGFAFTGALCDAVVCQNACSGAAKGTCGWTAPDALPKCACTGQFSGPDCSIPVCTPSCLNGATCVDQIPPVCSCQPGWQGPDCGTVIAVGTCPSNCGVGNCSAATNFTCICPAGYSGNMCQILSCPNGCSSNGICVAGGSNGEPPICNCSSSWSGAACNMRQCVADDCLNGGTCLISSAGVSCACTQGWTGSNCALPFSGAIAPSEPSLSVGAIVGIAVGAVVFGVALAVAIALIYRYQNVTSMAKMRQQIRLQTKDEITATYTSM